MIRWLKQLFCDHGYKVFVSKSEYSKMIVTDPYLCGIVEEQKYVREKYKCNDCGKEFLYDYELSCKIINL